MPLKIRLETTYDADACTMTIDATFELGGANDKRRLWEGRFTAGGREWTCHPPSPEVREHARELIRKEEPRARRDDAVWMYGTCVSVKIPHAVPEVDAALAALVSAQRDLALARKTAEDRLRCVTVVGG